jgi:hypothetical protein
MASGNDEGRVDERNTRNAPIYIGQCHNLVVSLLGKAVARDPPFVQRHVPSGVRKIKDSKKHHDRRAHLTGKESFAQRLTAEYL